MPKTLSDVELETMEIIGEAEETTKKGWGLKFWLLVPVALATVGTASYFIVRRIFGSSEK